MLEMPDPFHVLIAAFIALLVAVAQRHPTVHCPAGSYANGVQAVYIDGQRGSTGHFECRTIPPLIWSEEHPPYTPVVTLPTNEDIVGDGYIYCTGGTIPILLDARTIGCQHR